MKYFLIERVEGVGNTCKEWKEERMKRGEKRCKAVKVMRKGGKYRFTHEKDS